MVQAYDESGPDEGLHVKIKDRRMLEIEIVEDDDGDGFTITATDTGMETSTETTLAMPGYVGVDD